MELTGNFDDRIVLLTGTARGIGQACARLFAEGGATVVGGDVRDQSETVDVCADTPGRFEPLDVDVTTDDVEALVEQGVDFGGVDVLVNGAGVVERAGVENFDDEAWDRSLDVNLSGPFRLVRAAAPHLREREGAVVNVSSIYGQVGTAARAGYVASKSGLEGFTRAMAAELGPDGVRVNAVAPGFVRTPMTEPYLDDPEAVEAFRSAAALERLGDPEEVANVVGFLASDAAGFVTGETVLVDGGRATVE